MARDTIERIAAERTAPLRRLGRDFHVEGDSQRFSYRGRQQYDDLQCALIGDHQVQNAACAIALLEAAESAGFRANEAATRHGLRTVRWEGRLEVVSRQPLLLVDGAHNPAGAVSLGQFLAGYRRRHGESRVLLVLGMMRDKDHQGFAEPLKGLVDHVIFTQADLPRSAPAQALQQELRHLFPSTTVAAVPADAIAQAKQHATADDLICVTGSLMLVGEVKALVRGCGLSPLRG